MTVISPFESQFCCFRVKLDVHEDSHSHTDVYQAVAQGFNCMLHFYLIVKAPAVPVLVAHFSVS